MDQRGKKMSLWGLGKGLFKVVTGVMESDSKKVFMGVAQSGFAAGGMLISNIHKESGKQLSQHSENMD
jgi:hypothetical protein